MKKINRDTNDQDEIFKKKYHPDFWKNNPIIKRTPIEDNIIKSFEKEALFGTLTDLVK